MAFKQQMKPALSLKNSVVKDCMSCSDFKEDINTMQISSTTGYFVCLLQKLKTGLNFHLKLGIYASIFSVASNIMAYPLGSLMRNDPYPIFSTVYPYSFITSKQKANLINFDYTYPETNFYFSFSPFYQSACRARDSERNVVHLGDFPNGRWNVLGMFYDPPMRDRLFSALDLNRYFNADCPLPGGSTALPCDCDPNVLTATSADDLCRTFNLIVQPYNSDPNQEFGFFSIPVDYKKFGIRFESEFLLVNKCFYAIGIEVQGGVVDVRQSIRQFNDLTYQALGLAAPIPKDGSGLSPSPADQVGITPPYARVNPDGCTTGNTPFVPACPSTGPQECAVAFQPFRPCFDSNNLCCFSYDCAAKKLVIDKIMKQIKTITDILGYDITNYHKIGVEDLRVSLFWRQIFVINEETDVYPRLLFMPFASAGAILPMSKAQPTYKPFAVPIGNNNHAGVGVAGGFTLDFLDTIDLTFSGGYTHFFKHDYCNYRMPTNIYESGIYPYSADISLEPGATWHLALGMNAYHFLDNLSVWAEYLVTSHAQDKIKVCKSFIPSTSNYFKTGFLVEDVEANSKWESQVFNIGFNYDLSNNLSIGFAWQLPVWQRNVYRASTLMGSITFLY